MRINYKKKPLRYFQSLNSQLAGWNNINRFKEKEKYFIMTSTDSNLLQEGNGVKLYKPGLSFPSRPTTDEFYNVNFPKKALVVVFNHNEYENDSAPRRDGSDKDVDKLIETFGTPDFDVRDFNDLTSDEIRNKLDDCE